MEPFSIVGAAGAVIGIVGMSQFLQSVSLDNPRLSLLCNAHHIYGTEFEDCRLHGYSRSDTKANVLSTSKM